MNDISFHLKGGYHRWLVSRKGYSKKSSRSELPVFEQTETWTMSVTVKRRNHSQMLADHTLRATCNIIKGSSFFCFPAAFFLSSCMFARWIYQWIFIWRTNRTLYVIPITCTYANRTIHHNVNIVVFLYSQKFFETIVPTNRKEPFAILELFFENFHNLPSKIVTFSSAFLKEIILTIFYDHFFEVRTTYYTDHLWHFPLASASRFCGSEPDPN